MPRLLANSRPHTKMNKILPPARTAKYKKGKIPKALREALWLKWSGKSFEVKCHTTWCQNQITAYDFQAGHNIPESRGGATTMENLVPICSRCNLSMGSQYTFDEWCTLEGGATAAQQKPTPRSSWIQRFFCCTSDAAVNVAPIAHTAGPVIGTAPTLSSSSAHPHRLPRHPTPTS
jgi:hypothetical protein